MNASSACIALVQRFETCRLSVYLDTNGFPTVGWGHMDKAMRVGDTITQAQADLLLENDLNTAEDCLDKSVTRQLSQPQYDALCSFIYNVGCSVWRKTKLLGLVEQGSDIAAANDLLRFSHDSSGHFLPGLYDRRMAEREMYLGTGTASST